MFCFVDLMFSTIWDHPSRIISIVCSIQLKFWNSWSICFFSREYMNRVPKWWRHKKFICEITSLVVIFRKIKMKNASMRKFGILPPISDAILPRFCSDYLIQIVIKIDLVPNVKNQVIFRRICMESLIVTKDTYIYFWSLGWFRQILYVYKFSFLWRHTSPLYWFKI